MIYVLVALAAVAAVLWQDLGVNPEPIATIASKINPSSKAVLSVIALFSAGNTILIACFFALFKDIETVAEVSNLWIFIVYASVNFSALLILIATVYYFLNKENLREA